MSKDDYFAIVYKLLKHLYECLKQGMPVRPEMLCSEYFGINDAYWEYIVRHLYLSGYVEGVVLLSLMGKIDQGVRILPNFKITPLGIEYLSENSMVQKVRGAVKEIAPFIP